MTAELIYPITLHLNGRPCVVVGGGRVAARKVRDLLAAGALVTVISPSLSPALAALAQQGDIDWRQKRYTPGDLRDLKALLVFAATDIPAVNRTVAQEARDCGAWVNVADETAAGDFGNLITLRRESLMVAVHTGGASALLSKRLLADIDAAIDPAYVTLARWLAELRPLVKERIAAQEDRQRFWQVVMESDIFALLQSGDEAAARKMLDAFWDSFVGANGRSPLPGDESAS